MSEALRGQLRRNINGIERNDYNTSQRFLCGLKYEPEIFPAHEHGIFSAS